MTGLPKFPEPINIDRIVAAVDAVADVPEDLDKTELLSDLEGLRSAYRDVCAIRHERAKRRTAMEEAINLGRRLKSNLYVRADYDLCVELDRFLRPGHLATVHKSLWRFLSVNKGVSAFDYLMEKLFRTFKKHFKIGKKYSKDSHAEHDPFRGTFIVFAKAVLQEFNMRRHGRPYSSGLIADALTRGSRPYREKRRK